jgi:hypothetical protein
MKNWPIIEVTDKSITPMEDMKDILDRVDSIIDGKHIEDILKGIFAKNSKEYEKVETTLLARKRVLRTLLTGPAN